MERETPEQSSQDRGWKRLNADAVERISDFLVEDDPRQTVRNLTTLRSLDKSIKSLYDDSGKVVLETINRARNLAGRVYSYAVPESGFEPYFDSKMLDKADAGTRIEAIGGTLHLLSQRQRSDLVTHVLNLEDGYQQASAVAALSPHINNLRPQEKERIIQRAFDYASNYSARGNRNLVAAGIEALSCVHDDLTGPQQEYLQRIVNNRNMHEHWEMFKEGRLGRNDYIGLMRQLVKEELERDGITDLKDKISAIEHRVNEVIESEKSDFDKMRRLEKLQYGIADIASPVHERRGGLDERRDRIRSGLGL